ncbi:MAG: HzsA-related protein [Thermogutta sp.]
MRISLAGWLWKVILESRATVGALSLALGMIVLAGLASGNDPVPVTSSVQTEVTDDLLVADFLRQAELRESIAGQRAAQRPEEDARGGCDGVKNGQWGFHTEREPQPWWQVDLGDQYHITKILIFNRCDTVAPRANRLQVLLSADGESWTKVYEHDGTVFYGHTDGKPLAVQLSELPARFVRVQLPETDYLHLDEVEVYVSEQGVDTNVALGKPANQSSLSRWSIWHPQVAQGDRTYPLEKTIARGLALADELLEMWALAGVSREIVEREQNKLKELSARAGAERLSAEERRQLYLDACLAVRKMSWQNPLLDFKDLVFVKRKPPVLHHMSDQHYGWWCQGDGGLFILEDWKSDRPRLRCLTTSLPSGTVLRPDVSYDGTRILFAYARFYPGLHQQANKLDKNNVPEDAFFHIYEVNIDGTGLRRLTYGKYDDMDARYLPDGRIVFLSTRRGRSTQVLPQPVRHSPEDAAPDCYVRCGGGPERPVAIYTLHVMDADGKNIHPISPFESFEWHPSVDFSGRILYARWDYVDRHNQPFMSLWSTLPDGTSVQAVYGNFTWNPLSIFEARCVPGSHKIVFTASAHHSITGGSLALLDPRRGFDDELPLSRLTPEVCFPESEGWPLHYYANPYPLSEEFFLVSWSDQPLADHTGRMADAGSGIYLYDSFGNLNLIYRDPAIGCECPLPLKPRAKPCVAAAGLPDEDTQEGYFVVSDVEMGMMGVPKGTVKRLRLVGIPVKTHPTMNYPELGLTREDPGKFVLGTVPVEPDGSAYFRAPAGVSLFFQALDETGMAVRTMRTAIYVQPGQIQSCIGCHEPRNMTPSNRPIAALGREPSFITPGPEGSWPFDYDRLVQPVLDRHCVNCHQPGTKAAAFDLTPENSYKTLVHYGHPSLAEVTSAAYRRGRSLPGEGMAKMNPLWGVLAKGSGAKLTPEDKERLIIWMDLYGQKKGYFDEEQYRELLELQEKWRGLFVPGEAK